MRELRPRTGWLLLGSVLLVAACGRSGSGESDGFVVPQPHAYFVNGGDSPDGTPTPTATDTSPDGTPTPSPTDTSPDGTPTPTDTPTSTPDDSPTPTPTPDGCPSVVLDVTNAGASSALVLVNGVKLVAQSEFPTGAEIVVPFEPLSGPNDVAAKINGSPDDVIHVVVRTEDSSVVYLDETLTRTTGKPEWVDATFWMTGCDAVSNHPHSFVGRLGR